MAKAQSELSFAAVGNFGVEGAIDGDYVYLRIPTDRTKGRVSQTGKMILTGSTGGFAAVPGSDGFKLNVSAGWAAKA